MFDLEKTVDLGQSTFRLRSMTGEQQMAFFLGVQNEADKARAMYDLLRGCLLGWTDAKALNGEPLGDFDVDKVRWLGINDADALTNHLLDMSGLGDDEKKPLSDSPSSGITGTSSDVVTVTAKQAKAH